MFQYKHSLSSCTLVTLPKVLISGESLETVEILFCPPEIPINLGYYSFQILQLKMVDMERVLRIAKVIISIVFSHSLGFK